MDYVDHPNLATMQYSAFFHMCRLHGVCFDVARSVGTVFLLADSLTAGVFGLISSGEAQQQALQYARTALEVIGHDVGTQSLLVHDDTPAVYTPSGNFAEILAVMRALLKDKSGKTRSTLPVQRVRRQPR
jgi:hypothetical protein